MLAVCAHPDDESFGLGAALHQLASAGARVAVLCLTHGEASTLGLSDEDLGAIREHELARAATELGVAQVTVLDHRDGALGDEDLEHLGTEVADAVARWAPDLLVVFDEGGVTGHPDHDRATEAALAGAPELPVLAWVIPAAVAEALNGEFGTHFAGRRPAEIDLSIEVDREVQRRAISAHVSQCTENPVLWRRLELQGTSENFRWLRPQPPTPPSHGAGPPDAP